MEGKKDVTYLEDAVRAASPYVCEHYNSTYVKTSFASVFGKPQVYCSKGVVSLP